MDVFPAFVWTRAIAQYYKLYRSWRRIPLLLYVVLHPSSSDCLAMRCCYDNVSVLTFSAAVKSPQQSRRENVAFGETVTGVDSSVVLDCIAYCSSRRSHI